MDANVLLRRQLINALVVLRVYDALLGSSLRRKTIVEYIVELVEVAAVAGADVITHLLLTLPYDILD